VGTGRVTTDKRTRGQNSFFDDYENKRFKYRTAARFFLEHVRYEVQSLLNATIAIEKRMVVPQGLQCMIVESFSIHLRNLITFFYPYTSRPDDVCAKDFFVKENSWEEVRPKLNDVLKQAKTRADVEVGHLTTFRKNGTSENKDWDVKRLTAEIVPIFELFCKSTDKLNLKTDIDDILRHYSYLNNLKC
jgi:hypothetical protein